MKRTLAMILALVLSLSLLAGCGSTKSDDAAADGQSGSRPSIVRFSADSTPKIDPAVINDLVGSICVSPATMTTAPPISTIWSRPRSIWLSPSMLTPTRASNWIASCWMPLPLWRR